MNTDEMTLERFSELLETYGGDLSRWPADEQAMGDALMQRSPAAQRLQGQAARLDEALLAALPPLDASGLAMLKRRVLARIAAAALENSAIMRFWSWLLEGPRVAHFLLLRPVVLAMIPLLLGFALGMLLPEADRFDGDLATEMTLLSLTEPYEGFPDVR